MITRYNLDRSRMATFNETLSYRYELLIRWSDGPLLVMCACNPSVASHERSDPTVTRQCERAARLGFGAFLMLNAFAIRATDPRVMLKAADPYGEWRDAQCLVDSYFRHGGAQFIAAWGAHAKHRNRHVELVEAFTDAGIPIYALARTKLGWPHHPLYLAYEKKPFLYAGERRAA